MFRLAIVVVSLTLLPIFDAMPLTPVASATQVVWDGIVRLSTLLWRLMEMSTLSEKEEEAAASGHYRSWVPSSEVVTWLPLPSSPPLALSPANRAASGCADLSVLPPNFALIDCDDEAHTETSLSYKRFDGFDPRDSMKYSKDSPKFIFYTPSGCPPGYGRVGRRC